VLSGAGEGALGGGAGAAEVEGEADSGAGAGGSGMESSRVELGVGARAVMDGVGGEEGLEEEAAVGEEGEFRSSGLASTSSTCS
jgi:hypothetical protein